MKITYGNISRQELYRLAEHPATINLAGYKNPRQIKQERKLNKVKSNVNGFVNKLLALSKILFISAVLIFSVTIYKSVNADLQTTIRESRIETCQQAYDEYKDWINERYIHTNQNWVARCFAYSSIIFAKETGFGASRMCIQDNNCHGIKLATYDFSKGDIPFTVGNNRFLIFEKPKDSNLAFARLYARWHLNKTADTFVRGVWFNGQRAGARSLTDQDTYVKFIQDNFWEFYNIGINLINNK